MLLLFSLTPQIWANLMLFSCEADTSIRLQTIKTKIHKKISTITWQESFIHEVSMSLQIQITIYKNYPFSLSTSFCLKYWNVSTSYLLLSSKGKTHKSNNQYMLLWMTMTRSSCWKNRLIFCLLQLVHS